MPSASLQAELATMPKCPQFKEMLEHYYEISPKNRADFDDIYTALSNKVGSFQVRRYNHYSTFFTNTHAQAIGDQIYFIMSEYGLDGTNGPTGLSVRQRPDGRVQVSWTDNANGETSYVLRVKASNEVVFTQLGTASANAVTFLTDVMTNGAYTFSVAAINADSTETMPGELYVNPLPSTEQVTSVLQHRLFDESVGAFTLTNFVSTLNDGSDTNRLATSLKISASNILELVRTESSDSGIQYVDVSLNQVLLEIPSNFVSAPLAVEVLNEDTMTYAAFAGGSNTSGDPATFATNTQQIDLTSRYSFSGSNDFRFMLYNTASNAEESVELATLRIDYDIVSGYRYWSESNGLVSGVNADRNDDPDGDGTVNFAEYAFDRNPLQGESDAPLTIHSTVDSSCDLRFLRGQSSIRYLVDSTTDLLDWSGSQVIWDSDTNPPGLVAVGQEQTVSLGVLVDQRRYYRINVSE